MSGAGPTDWREWVRARLDLAEVLDEEALSVVEEIAQLLREHYEDLRSQGHPAAAADAATREHIQDWEALRSTVTAATRRSQRKTATQRLAERVESHAAARGGRWRLWSDLATDVHFALRTLRLSPGSSLVIILTLALGIGAGTMIYSVVDAVVLRPLPYPDAGRLGVITFTGQGLRDEILVTPSNVLDFRDQARSLEALETYASFTTTLTLEDGSIVFVPVAVVDTGLPALLGIDPALGRHLDPAVAAAAGGDGNGVTEVLLSEELWERSFGADPGVIGREVIVNDDDPMRIVGIVPRGTRMLVHPEGEREHIDLWMARAPIRQRANIFSRRALVRVAAGATFDQASTEVNGIAERNRERDFENEDGRGQYAVVPLHDNLVRNVQPALLLLMGAAGFVLVLVCTNVANLLLGRSLQRRQEWALRAALGAARGRIVRLGLTESLVLATIGGALGLLLARWGLQLLPLIQPENLPRAADVAISVPVLGFAATVSLVTALLFGLVPSWSASRLDLQEALKEGGRVGTSAGASRLNQGLVALQFAIALTLVVGSGLMLRTFVNLQSVDVGFRPDGLLTFETLLSGEMQSEPSVRLQFVRTLLERLEALPGVESASMTNIVPLSGGFNGASWAYDAATIERFGELSALFRRVMPGYFHTLQIPFLAGRDFTADDVDNNRYVLIVSERMAQIAWPSESPLGKRVTIDFATPSGSTELREAEVVGVVSSTRDIALHGDEPPTAYLPVWSTRAVTRALVRTTGDPLALVPTVRALVQELGIQRPLDNVRAVQQNLDDATQETRFVLWLTASFSGLAVLLASLGVYGVASQLVGRRRREIGVRMALGAQRPAVLRMVLRQGVSLALAGLAVGTVVALAGTRLIRSFLYGVEAWDPATFLGVGVLLVAVAAVATLFPAVRASRLDPISVLREE